MHYHAFISYRRDHFFEAQFLCDRLFAKGISCYLDLENQTRGSFDEHLYSAIHEAPNFILLLSKNSLNRCVAPKDWVRLEILAAIHEKKNIIPVTLPDFKWPDSLDDSFPPEFSEFKLKTLSRVCIEKEYLDAPLSMLF